MKSSVSQTGDTCRQLDPLGPVLLDVPGLARFLGIGRSKVYQLDSLGQIPAPIQLGASRRWLLVEVEAWLAHGAPGRDAWRRTWNRIRRELYSGRQAPEKGGA